MVRLKIKKKKIINNFINIHYFIHFLILSYDRLFKFYNNKFIYIFFKNYFRIVKRSIDLKLNIDVLLNAYFIPHLFFT